ncbi:hypothetical protein LZ198_35500 [Myxococcus sp. K15C18031901]|uniref:hypothetical protein n=1 Tax=Myxococcus dinghuensis TaxID=2906761 RepID=UPI0020A6DB29|nr:hypothetical protein [Myxococcus dinghuensis]MCP3104183.1 hypothetical protein [Myxococcus dinghuensis]
MTYLTRMPWCGVGLFLFGLLVGCQGGMASGDDGVSALDTSEAPLACACGATRYSVVRRTTGVTCAEAYDKANKLADTFMFETCPSGGCDITRSLMSCSPVVPGGNQGFSMGVTMTFSCNEPAGCEGT